MAQEEFTLDEIVAVLVGDTPESTDVEWLGCLLSDLRTRIDENPKFREGFEGDDPSAAYQALAEATRIAGYLTRFAKRHASMMLDEVPPAP